MKKQPTINKLLPLIMAILLVSFFPSLPRKASAQLIDLPTDTGAVQDAFPDAFPLEGTGGTTGGSQDDAISERQKLDDAQTKLEAERLKKAQEEEDIKVCKKDQESVNTEVGGSGAGGSQVGQDDAYDPNNQDSPVNQGPIPSACQQGDGSTAGYIAANEGIRNQAYTDSRGYRTIGVGHRITGNEPFPTDGTLTDDQVNQLYDADMATARTNAQASAERHGVDWDSLSPERQTALTDMSFNMGASGGQGLDGFDNMWANTREAQRTGSQEAWDAAGDEVMDSPYASQVGQRSNRNAELMRNSDGSIIDQRISEDTAAQAFCGGTTAFNWQKPFSIFSLLFKADNVFAQTYVPVQEQNGSLMDKTEAIRKQTKNIEKYTEQTKNLSIQICTHLRAIKRIQQVFEKKMVEDANVSRAKATEIAKYAEAMYGENGAIKKGGARINGNGEEVKDTTLYVENNEALWKEQSREAEKVAYANLAESSNPNINVVMENLKNDNSSSIESDMTDEDMATLSGGTDTEDGIVTKKDTGILLSNHIPIFSTLLSYLNRPITFMTGRNVFAVNEEPSQSNVVKSDDFWNSFKKLAEPKNNRFGSYLIAADQIETSKNRAIQSARDEALQGQGFLGTRTCVQKTPDGKDCAQWKIIQPGVIVKETQAATMNSRLRQQELADQMGDLAPGNGPDVTELLDNNPVSTGGGALGPGMTAPADIATQAEDRLRSDPSTNQGGDSGGDGGDAGDYGEGGSGWGDLTGIVEGLFSEDGGANPESNEAIQLILAALKDLLDSMKPWVIFKAKDMGDGISRVYWYSPNADNCISNNKWLAGDGVTVIKETGSSLEKTGSIDIAVISGQSVEYKIKCNNSNGGSTRNLKVRR